MLFFYNNNLFNNNLKKKKKKCFRSLGCDFTQHKQRSAYSKKCFDEDPPKLETLTLISTDQRWKIADGNNEISDDEIYLE